MSNIPPIINIKAKKILMTSKCEVNFIGSKNGIDYYEACVPGASLFLVLTYKKGEIVEELQDLEAAERLYSVFGEQLNSERS